MKFNTNLFYWVLIAGTLTFILYQKGYIAANFESIDAKQAHSFSSDNNTTLLDVRTKEELITDGMIAGAIHIPLDRLKIDLEKLSLYKGQKIVVYCRSGNRSVSASRFISDAGYKAYNMRGGILSWKGENLPLSTLR